MIPFAAWMPDLPPYQSEGATFAQNVAPRAGGYEPVRNLERITEAAVLDAPSIGAASIYSQSSAGGGALTLAGTASKLVRVTTSGATDLATGLSIADGWWWSFAPFGASVYSAALGTGSTSVVSGAPSGITVVGTLKDHLFVARDIDGIEGLHWSAIGNADNWPTPASDEATQVQSGTQVLYNGLGRVHAIIGGLRAADGVIVQERGLTRATYVGSPAVWGFEAYEGSRGTPSPRSCIVAGGVLYYRGDDGFFATDGASASPIGEGRINRWFAADVSSSRQEAVVGFVDPARKVVGWAYPSQSAPAGLMDRALLYHYELDRWSVVVGWLLSDVFQLSQGGGFTVDAPGTYTGPIDSYDLAVDSRASGRGLGIAMLDSTRFLATPTGRTMRARIETGEVAPSGEGSSTITTQVRPFVDAAPGSIDASIGVRDRVQDRVSYVACGDMTRSGYLPVRARARLQRCRVDISSNSQWTYAQGVELTAVPTGRVA